MLLKCQLEGCLTCITAPVQPHTTDVVCTCVISNRGAGFESTYGQQKKLDPVYQLEAETRSIEPYRIEKPILPCIEKNDILGKNRYDTILFRELKFFFCFFLMNLNLKSETDRNFFGQRAEVIFFLFFSFSFFFFLFLMNLNLKSETDRNFFWTERAEVIFFSFFSFSFLFSFFL